MAITVHGIYAPNVYCSFQHFLGDSLRNGSDFKTFKGLRKRRRIRDFAFPKVESLCRNIKSQNPEDTSHNHSSSVSSLQSLEETVSNNQFRNLVTRGRLDEGLKFLESTKRRGHIPDIKMCTSLMYGFCGRGKTREAIRVLEIVEDSGAVDVKICTILIKATCKERGVEQAMKLFDKMRNNGCKPNVVTYNVLLDGICKEGRLDDAIKFLNDVSVVYGCQPDVINYKTVLYGLCSACRWKEAERLIADMLRKGYTPDSTTMYSSSLVVHGLCLEGKFDEAISLFNGLKRKGVRPNVVAYNRIISGLCKAQQTDLAIDFLACMVMEGCTPNEFTYRSLIEGIAYQGLAKEALELFNELSAKGVFQMNC